jgi:hypothetical protein
MTAEDQKKVFEPNLGTVLYVLRSFELSDRTLRLLHLSLSLDLLS